jgi:hypothetical protein
MGELRYTGRCLRRKPGLTLATITRNAIDRHDQDGPENVLRAGFPRNPLQPGVCAHLPRPTGAISPP